MTDLEAVRAMLVDTLSQTTLFQPDVATPESYNADMDKFAATVAAWFADDGLTPAMRRLNQDAIDAGLTNAEPSSCDCNPCLRRRWEAREANRSALVEAHPHLAEEYPPQPCPKAGDRS